MKATLFLGFALLLALESMAWAQPGLEFGTNSPLVIDQGQPTLFLAFDEDVTDVTIVVKRKRKKVKEHFRSIEAGQQVEVRFESPLGVLEWDVEIDGQWAGENFTLEFAFTFEVFEGLVITIPPEELDLTARQLTMMLNRPAGHVDYVVMRDDGATIGEGRVKFNGEPPGTPLVVKWEQDEGTVLKIQLTAVDVGGTWAMMELIPWWVEIPHEEVHFATGSHEIPEDEQYKIDDAYAELVKEVNKYGEFVQIRLYVAGYTDTVGSRSDNQALSDRRAKSLAKAFRVRGFPFPIYYQGFGEDALAVQTQDDTEEIRNRRALYILAAEAPLPCPQLPRGSWRELR